MKIRSLCEIAKLKLVQVAVGAMSVATTAHALLFAAECMEMAHAFQSIHMMKAIGYGSLLALLLARVGKPKQPPTEGGAAGDFHP